MSTREIAGQPADSRTQQCSGIRLQPGARGRAPQTVEDASHEVEIDPADQGCVLGDERVERAVPQADLTTLAVRLEALVGEHARRAVEVVAAPVVRRADRAPAGVRLVAQRLSDLVAGERPLQRRARARCPTRS